jgi:hypothetical protein
MPRVGFEPTIPAFERVKTVYALDPAATVIGDSTVTGLKYVRGCVIPFIGNVTGEKSYVSV